MRYRCHEEWRDDPYHDYDWGNDGYPGEFVYGDLLYIDEYYMDERWKPVKGFENNYWVSDMARVWSVKSQQFLRVKPMDKHGHLGVCLHVNGRAYYRYIHRLVAEAFLPNPHNYPVVRHVDDCPRFNTADDIIWGTQRDNFYDSIRNGRAYIPSNEDREKGHEKTRTPICAINLQTGDRFEFRGQGEAERILNIPQANIWKVLNKQRRSAGGYYFEYLNRGKRYV